jgi:hypothetical protein
MIEILGLAPSFSSGEELWGLQQTEIVLQVHERGVSDQ